MEHYGFKRVAAAVPVVTVADCRRNAENILRMASEAKAKGAGIVAFPEMSVCGYTCADLFGGSKLISEAEEAVRSILELSAGLDIIMVFGAPVRYAGRLFNCALVSRAGRLLGIVPKTYLAGNAEFYEPRWFESARVLPDGGVDLDYAGQRCILGQNQLFRCGELLFGVELCQDLWAPVPPSSFATLAGAQLIVNLSASNEILLKNEYRRSLVNATASRLICAYLYCSVGYGESTQDLVWPGAAMVSEYGSILAENERFRREDSLPLRVGDEAQLFVDDGDIAALYGQQRVRV